MKEGLVFQERKEVSETVECRDTRDLPVCMESLDQMDQMVPQVQKEGQVQRDLKGQGVEWAMQVQWVK